MNDFLVWSRRTFYHFPWWRRGLQGILPGNVSEIEAEAAKQVDNVLLNPIIFSYGVTSKFKESQNVNRLGIATLLDPHSKRIGFTNKDARKFHETNMIEAMKPMFVNIAPSQAKASDTNGETTKEEPPNKPI